MGSGAVPQQAESKMVNTIVFYQVSHMLGCVLSELETWQNDHGDDLSSDMERVREMIDHVSSLTSRYKERHPRKIDPEVVKSVYSNLHALQEEIKRDIMGSINGATDSETYNNIEVAMDRIRAISEWYPSDSTELSLRINEVFAPLVHDDPSEWGELYRAQDSFLEYLDRMSISLQERLNQMEDSNARQYGG
jgi:hypothetical protein